MTTRQHPARADKLEELHRQLLDTVAELSTSQAWQRMLSVAARFHDYSPSNVLLIGAQRPDATRVAGIRTWNSLGRHVIKGERGIAILAPSVYRAAPGDTAVVDDRAARGATEAGPDTAAPPGAPDVPGEEPARQVRGFRVVYVFDVSQTAGDPLPDVAPDHLTGAEPKGLWDHLAGLVDADGYRLERGPVPLANGYTDYRTRTVRVSDRLAPAQAVKTLAHEVGHIRADHEHRFTDYAINQACRGQAEVEAESIAYLITAQAGLDSAAYSVPYVTGWSGGHTDALRQSMTTVITCARAIGAPAISGESPASGPGGHRSEPTTSPPSPTVTSSLIPPAAGL